MGIPPTVSLLETVRNFRTTHLPSSVRSMSGQNGILRFSYGSPLNMCPSFALQITSYSKSAQHGHSEQDVGIGRSIAIIPLNPFNQFLPEVEYSAKRTMQFIKPVHRFQIVFIDAPVIMFNGICYLADRYLIDIVNVNLPHFPSPNH